MQCRMFGCAPRGLAPLSYSAALNRYLYNLQVWITASRVTGSDVAAHVISILDGAYQIDPVRAVLRRPRAVVAYEAKRRCCRATTPRGACVLTPRSRAQAPYTTAGQRILPGRGLRKTLMEVSDDICWYLDATFCYGFNRYREDGHDVEQVIQARSYHHLDE